MHRTIGIVGLALVVSLGACTSNGAGDNAGENGNGIITGVATLVDGTEVLKHISFRRAVHTYASGPNISRITLDRSAPDGWILTIAWTGDSPVTSDTSAGDPAVDFGAGDAIPHSADNAFGLALVDVGSDKWAAVNGDRTTGSIFGTLEKPSGKTFEIGSCTFSAVRR